MNFIKKNWFLVVLFVSLVIGFSIPEIGISISFGKITTTALIVLIFLITGYTIPTEAIATGLKDFRLHIFLQVFIFLVIPLYFVLTLKLFSGSFPPGIQVGIIALACLPTTISSCVIFTQISGGNVVGAMFNAALANLLGVFVSPLLLSFFLNTSGHVIMASELSKIIISIGLKILLPLFLGQLVRTIRIPALSVKKRLSLINSIAILLITFINFSKSAADPVFRQTLPQVIGPVLYLAVSFLILLGLSYVLARVLKFNSRNIITIVLTAPQKTLAMGVPLLSTFFVNSPELLGMALLPLLFYYPWQLLISGIIKGFLMKKIA